MFNGALNQRVTDLEKRILQLEWELELVHEYLYDISIRQEGYVTNQGPWWDPEGNLTRQPRRGL